VHCPLVSARGGSILKSFSGLKARGINIAMGTDTTPPDMLMNLLVGLITCRVADAVMEPRPFSRFVRRRDIGRGEGAWSR
jgi:cytosine/adenosine deaminase-related metal-dependent hydrolase